MPIPYKPLDMKKIVVQIDEDCRNIDESIGVRRRAEAQDEYDEERKRWLDQYDDTGHLKPGLFGTAEYVPNRSISFLSMSPDERAAFVVAEKKRKGLL